MQSSRPWLVDVVDTDLESLAATVNSLLAPGGRWVCSGTLFFQQADPAQAYSSEEVQEIVAGAGFESPELKSSRQPYLASPASRHARVEEVVTFAVHKQREAESAAATVAVLAGGSAASGATVARGGRPRTGPQGA